jgi:hypothetical protein
LERISANLRTNGKWHGMKDMNWAALFLQCGGVVAGSACQKCTKGSGLWKECIVAQGDHDDVHYRTKGACVCCLYNGLGSQYSFVKSTSTCPFRYR